MYQNRRYGRVWYGPALVCLTLLVILRVPAWAGLEDGTSWEQFAGNVVHAGFTNSTAPDITQLAWSSEAIGANGSSSVVVADDKVFVYGAPTGFDGDGTSAVVCLNAVDGTTKWTTPVEPAEYGSWSSPAYHDGKVFISSGKETWCLNAEDGVKIWAFRNPSEEASCNGGPTVADGKVFCSDWNGGHYYCPERGGRSSPVDFRGAGVFPGHPGLPGRQGLSHKLGVCGGARLLCGCCRWDPDLAPDFSPGCMRFRHRFRRYRIRDHL